MARIFIPLYVRPARLVGDAGIPANFSLDPSPEEGAILLTRESLADPEIRDLINSIGVPALHIHSTRAEAEAAAWAVSHHLPDLDTITGCSRDGDGILVTIKEAGFLMGDDFELKDMRRNIDYKFKPEPAEIEPSWQLSEAECAELMSAPASASRRDLEASVIDILSSIANKEVLRDIQLAMEYLPGAYVSYLSLSPEDLRSDDSALLRHDADDAAVQGFLITSASKVELGTALEEAVQDVMERVSEAHPELIDSDEGMEP